MKGIGKKQLIIIIGAAVAVITAVIIILLLNINSGYRSISISEIYGMVTAENKGNTYAAYKDMRLSDGYALTTDNNSYTRMVLDDDKYVKLEQNSRALFQKVGSDRERRTAINLQTGALTAELVKPLAEKEDFVINTPNAVLAVRGTYFRVNVLKDENGEINTDVYTYGGSVVCKRVMPDGSVVDEEVVISAGFKARINMDSIITVYVEDRIPENEYPDNVDPIWLTDISDNNIVEMYGASVYGHKLFVETEDIWNEIEERGIKIDEHKAIYDNKPLPKFDKKDNGQDHDRDDGGSSDKNDSSTHRPNDTGNDSRPDNRPDSGNGFGGENGSDGGNDDGDAGSSGSLSTPDDMPDESGSSDTQSNTESNTDNTESNTDNTESNQDSGDSNSDSDASSSDSDINNGDTSDSGNNSTGGNTGDNTHGEAGGSEQPSEAVTAEADNQTEEISELTEETNVQTSEATIESKETAEQSEESAETSENTETEEQTEESAESTENSETSDKETAESNSNDDSSQSDSEDKRDNYYHGGYSGGGGSSGHTHSFTDYVSNNDATCTADGTKTAVCTCGITNTITDTGSAKGHSYTDTVTEPTCTEKGYTTHTCTACGDVVIDTETAAKGHSYTDTVTEPTCTEKGYTTHTCTACGDVVTDTETAAKGHTEATEVIPSTLGTAGKITKYCSVCEEILEETEVDQLTCLYTEDGNIVITETGYKQGEATEEIPYTGVYSISQHDSSTAVDMTITVESGTHNIFLDEIYLKREATGIIMDFASPVTLSGNAEIDYSIWGIITDSQLIFDNFNLEMKQISTKGFYGINISKNGSLIVKENSSAKIISTKHAVRVVNTMTNSGNIEISSASGGIRVDGQLTAEKGSITINAGTSNAITCVNSGNVLINGGTITCNAEGNYCIKGDADTPCSIPITGGSVKLTGASGVFSNAELVNANGDTVYSVPLPCADITTVQIYDSMDNEYPYSFNAFHEDEQTAYIWLPVGKYTAEVDGTTKYIKVTEDETVVSEYQFMPVGSLFTEDGNITITSTGYKQGDDTDETPYTGSYTILQQNIQTPADCSITVVDGQHEITVKDIFTSCADNALELQSGAEVVLFGEGVNNIRAMNLDGISAVYVANGATLEIAEGEFTLVGDNFGVTAYGEVQFSGSSVSAKGGQAGIYCAGGGEAVICTGATVNAYGVGDEIWGYGIYVDENSKLTMQGGTVTSDGLDSLDYCDLYVDTTGTAEISGGSFKPAGGAEKVGRVLSPDSRELELITLDTYQSAFTDGDKQPYTYSLAEAENTDGIYYIWLPKKTPGLLFTEDGNITITSTGYTQGSAAAETPYVGDYTIAQKDTATAADMTISIDSGTHNVRFDEVNVNSTSNTALLYVSSNANVNISGVGSFISDSTNCFSCYGITNIHDGTLSFETNMAVNAATVTNGAIVIKGNGLTVAGTANITAKSNAADGTAVAIQVYSGELVIEDSAVVSIENNTNGYDTTTQAYTAIGGMYIMYGKTTVNGGTLDIASQAAGIYIDSKNDSQLTVNGGQITINSESSGIRNCNVFTCTGGNIDITSSGSCISNTGTSEINGGSCQLASSNGNGFDILSGNVTIASGTLDVNADNGINYSAYLSKECGITVTGGTVTFSGLTELAKYTGSNPDYCKLYFDGGSVKVTGADSSASVINDILPASSNGGTVYSVPLSCTDPTAVTILDSTGAEYTGYDVNAYHADENIAYIWLPAGKYTIQSDGKSYLADVTETLSTVTEFTAGTLYTEDGDVAITETGYTQGGVTVAYTDDYTVAQRDSAAAQDMTISVDSGTHNIEFADVNVLSTDENGMLTVSSGATVDLSGTGTLASNYTCLKNNGTVNIESGELSFETNCYSIANPCSYSGIYNSNSLTVGGTAKVTAKSNQTYGATSSIYNIGSSAVLTLTDNAELNIENATTGYEHDEATSQMAAAGIYNSGSNAAVNVSGGSLNINSVHYGIINMHNNAATTINGGAVNITSDSSAIRASISAVVDISGGELLINSSGNAMDISSSSLTISDTASMDIQSSKTAMYIYESAVDISGGTINAISENMCINCQTDSIITVSGGEQCFESTNERGLYINPNSSFTMTDGALSINTRLYAIQLTNSSTDVAKVYLNGGTVTAESTNEYGIHNAANTVIQINGGSVKSVGSTGSVSAPALVTNANGDTVYCTEIPCTDPTTVTILDSTGAEYTGYDVNAYHADENIAYIWLPAGSYLISADGKRYDVTVTDTAVTIDEIPLGTLYTEHGDIIISDTYYTQGADTTQYSYSGDYTITQKDTATAVDMTISVDSGTHNIVFNDVNVSSTNENGMMTVDTAATVDLSGTGTFASDYTCLTNNGTVNIESGELEFGTNYYSTDSTSYGSIYNTGELTFGGTANVTVAANQDYGYVNAVTNYGSTATVTIKDNADVKLNNNSTGYKDSTESTTAATGCIYNRFGSELNIAGGELTIQSNCYGICNNDSVIDISDGTITVSADEGGIISWYGALNISGGNITIESKGVSLNLNDESANISGGNINLTATDNIAISCNGNTVITGGTISAETKLYYTIINNQAMTLAGGSFHAVGTEVFHTSIGTLPTNANGDTVYSVTLPCTDPATVTITDTAAGTEYTDYYVNAVHPDGNAYIWLPVGTYTITSDGNTYTAAVTDTGTTIT